jgi:hypothetical protein
MLDAHEWAPGRSYQLTPVATSSGRVARIERGGTARLFARTECKSPSYRLATAIDEWPFDIQQGEYVRVQLTDLGIRVQPSEPADWDRLDISTNPSARPTKMDLYEIQTGIDPREYLSAVSFGCVHFTSEWFFAEVSYNAKRDRFAVPQPLLLLSALEVERSYDLRDAVVDGAPCRYLAPASGTGAYLRLTKHNDSSAVATRTPFPDSLDALHIVYDSTYDTLLLYDVADSPFEPIQRL